ncbi:MAG: peptide-methionine (S)-S-oxide reductase MsrA [Saprospiraceae bacterium]
MSQSYISLGGGCFWCVEAVFQEVQGVHSAVSGYMGGHIDNPTYQDVCSGRSGHVEVVRIAFDPAQIDLADILDIFFATHDPTTPDRQGNDIGPQYRSVIFYENEDQMRAALEARARAASLWPMPIVTEIAPASRFYPAESYHQNYFKDNPRQPYCSFVIAPKVVKFRQKFKNKLKSEA